MCGICGLIEFSDPRPSEDLLWAMARTLRHRGPDDEGVFVEGPVGLAHTRLSIIDLSENGHQPMLSPDGRCAMVYNGEVYNFRELRVLLESDGVDFRGGSDSEVVLKSYLHWGASAFERLHGMFAIAIWDGRTSELLLARDRFGIKPLYYQMLDSSIVFGSEIKAIAASGRLRRTLNYAGLSEFMYYGTALGEHSMFSGVKKLPPGNLLSFGTDGAQITQFATIHPTEEITCDLESAAREVRSRLESAVTRHLVSDVPVGVFLSGGIDSSAITAFASRRLGGDLQTFSVGFDFAGETCELDSARAIAKSCGTSHHELHVKGESVIETVRALVRAHDEPFGDAADIPLYLLCKEVRGSIKVVLQGDGGDELFAGYRRYNVLDAERAWHWASRVANRIGKVVPESERKHRSMRFVDAMRQKDPAMRFALLLTEEGFANDPSRILSTDLQAAVRPHSPFRRYRELYRKFAHLDSVQRALYTDCSIILPDIFLEKVDKSTMAHGIEVRVPFLDDQLATYVMSVPSHMKIRRGQKKFLLRKALRGVVSDRVLDGPKTGFGVPYGAWLRGPLAGFLRDSVLDGDIRDLGLFDVTELTRCINEHVSGTRDHGFLLWKSLNLALWMKMYCVGAGEPRPVARSSSYESIGGLLAVPGRN